MSRSRRKTPILSYCTADDHEHWWKHAANRALRRAVRMALQRGSETLYRPTRKIGRASCRERV